MFFGKSKDSQQQMPRTYQWPEGRKKYQRIRISVDKFLYSVSGSYGHWSLELEGPTMAESLGGTRISISFEILDPFETPNNLRNAWKKFPESVEGTCRFQEPVTPFDPPFLKVTCYCEKEKPTLDLILRVAPLVSHSSTTVVVDLEIDFPDGADEDFWLETWRTRELQVRNWKIICGSN